MSTEIVLFETWLLLSNTHFSEIQINSLAATWYHGEAPFEFLTWLMGVSTGTESKTVAFYYLFIIFIYSLFSKFIILYMHMCMWRSQIGGC